MIITSRLVTYSKLIMSNISKIERKWKVAYRFGNIVGEIALGYSIFKSHSLRCYAWIARNIHLAFNGKIFLLSGVELIRFFFALTNTSFVYLKLWLIQCLKVSFHCFPVDTICPSNASRPNLFQVFFLN